MILEELTLQDIYWMSQLANDEEDTVQAIYDSHGIVTNVELLNQYLASFYIDYWTLKYKPVLEIINQPYYNRSSLQLVQIGQLLVAQQPQQPQQPLFNQTQQPSKNTWDTEEDMRILAAAINSLSDNQQIQMPIQKTTVIQYICKSNSKSDLKNTEKEFKRTIRKGGASKAWDAYSEEFKLYLSGRALYTVDKQEVFLTTQEQKTWLLRLFPRCIRVAKILINLNTDKTFLSNMQHDPDLLQCNKIKPGTKTSILNTISDRLEQLNLIEQISADQSTQFYQSNISVVQLISSKSELEDLVTSSTDIGSLGPILASLWNQNEPLRIYSMGKGIIFPDGTKSIIARSKFIDFLYSIVKYKKHTFFDLVLKEINDISIIDDLNRKIDNSGLKFCDSIYNKLKIRISELKYIDKFKTQESLNECARSYISTLDISKKNPARIKLMFELINYLLGSPTILENGITVQCTLELQKEFLLAVCLHSNLTFIGEIIAKIINVDILKYCLPYISDHKDRTRIEGMINCQIFNLNQQKLNIREASQIDVSNDNSLQLHVQSFAMDNSNTLERSTGMMFPFFQNNKRSLEQDESTLINTNAKKSKPPSNKTI